MDSLNSDELFGVFSISSTPKSSSVPTHIRFNESFEEAESSEEQADAEIGNGELIEKEVVLETSLSNIGTCKDELDLIDSKLDTFFEKNSVKNVASSEVTVSSKVEKLVSFCQRLTEENESLKKQLASLPEQDSYFVVDRRFPVNVKYDSPFVDDVSLGSPSNNSVMVTPKSYSVSCFNCDGNHTFSECPEPPNQAKIGSNRRAHHRMTKEKDIARARRYALDEKIKPGQISDTLRNALGLGENELPSWIYRMRKIGYPPGHLKEAFHAPSTIKILDEDDNEVLPKNGQRFEGYYDPSRIIDYPGFNVGMSVEIEDKHALHNAPPMQPRDCKEAFIEFLKSTLAQNEPVTENNRVERQISAAVDESMDICVADDSTCSSLVVVDEISEDNIEEPGPSNVQPRIIPLNEQSSYAPTSMTPSHSALSLSVELGTPISLGASFLNGSGDDSAIEGVLLHQDKPNLEAFRMGVNKFEYAEELPPKLNVGYKSLLKILAKKTK